jgi:hypothetical protein
MVPKHRLLFGANASLHALSVLSGGNFGLVHVERVDVNAMRGALEVSAVVRAHFEVAAFDAD